MSEDGRRRGHAVTAPDAADARLRGRTYAIPFETVWQAACTLAGGGLRGWQLASADDHDGIITGTADPMVGAGHDVTIRISLDADAQTRVDAEATARKPATDLGRSVRCLHRFFRALDRATAGAPGPGTARPS